MDAYRKAGSIHTVVVLFTPKFSGDKSNRVRNKKALMGEALCVQTCFYKQSKPNDLYLLTQLLEPVLRLSSPSTK